jgi:hypothetical protein
VARVTLHAVESAAVNCHDRALHIDQIVLAQIASIPFLNNDCATQRCQSTTALIRRSPSGRGRWRNIQAFPLIPAFLLPRAMDTNQRPRWAASFTADLAPRGTGSGGNGTNGWRTLMTTLVLSVLRGVSPPVSLDIEPAAAILLPMPGHPASARAWRALVSSAYPDVRATFVVVVTGEPHVPRSWRDENGFPPKWWRSGAHVDASARARACVGDE